MYAFVPTGESLVQTANPAPKNARDIRNKRTFFHACRLYRIKRTFNRKRHHKVMTLFPISKHFPKIF